MISLGLQPVGAAYFSCAGSTHVRQLSLTHGFETVTSRMILKGSCLSLSLDSEFRLCLSFHLCFL